MPMDSPSAGRDAEPLTPTSTSLPSKRHQACERCWKRKQKCDKVLPACSACAELEIQCVARKAPGLEALAEEVVLSQTAAIGYVESLKRKVDELEKSIQEAQRKRTRTSIGGINSAQNDAAANRNHEIGARTHDNGPAALSDDHGPTAPSGDTGDGSVRAMMGEIGFLSRSAMAEPRDESEGLPRRLALDKLITAALNLDGTDPSKAMKSSTPLSTLMIIKHHTTSLKREGTIVYMNYFMEEVSLHSLYFNKQRMREDYEAVVADTSGTDTDDVIIGDALARYFNAYIAVALGTLLSPDSARLTSFTTSLHTFAVNLVPAIMRLGDSLLTLQSMLALAVYSTLSASGGSTWHLVGLVMKKCISLGLHKEADPQAGLSSTEADERRRVFWGIYLLDRSLSLAMDRPFGIQDEDITVDVPHGDSNDDQPTYQGSKCDFCQHLITHARLSAQMRTADRVSPLFDYNNFCYWRDFPPNLERVPRESRKAYAGFLDHLSCRTLMQMIKPVDVEYEDNGPAALKGTRNVVETEAAGSCKLLVEHFYDCYDQGHLVGSFIDAYDIFSAGVIFACLTYRHSSNSSRSQDLLIRIPDVLNKCSTLIATITGRFSGLRVFQRVLLTLLSRVVELQAADRTISHRPRIFDNLPSAMPDRLRRLIKYSVQ